MKRHRITVPERPVPHRDLAEQAFTLLEAVLVIAILAIVAALVTPLAVNQIAQARYNSCREELKQIKYAMVGDANLVENGARSHFGFLGDLGVLPSAADGLEDLVSNTAGGGFTVVYLTWPQTHAATGLVWGWRGPYISEFTDPWGNNYNYTVAGLPLFIAARIRSAGADGVFNNTDDIIMDIRTDEISAAVSGNTLDECSRSSIYSSAPQIVHPSGTAGVTTATASYATPPIYRFTAIPVGTRIITYTTATPTTVRQYIAINNGPVIMFNLNDPGACN